MWQVWEYDTRDGRQRGISAGYSDFGGTDVTYRWHRLDADGRRIEFENGGYHLDSLNGPALKTAKRIGAMQPNGQFLEGDQ